MELLLSLLLYNICITTNHTRGQHLFNNNNAKPKTKKEKRTTKQTPHTHTQEHHHHRQQQQKKIARLPPLTFDARIYCLYFYFHPLSPFVLLLSFCFTIFFFFSTHFDLFCFDFFLPRSLSLSFFLQHTSGTHRETDQYPPISADAVIRHTH